MLLLRGGIVALVLLMMTGAGALAAPDAAAKPPATQPSGQAQVIILKFDDVYWVDTRHGVPPMWQKISDYVHQNGLKASYGIICDSLEHDNQRWIDFIKAQYKTGEIEFWCHGYHFRTLDDKAGEYEQGTAEDQKVGLVKSQKLAKEKLGFELKAFGPHWSYTNEATTQAIEQVPEFTIWFGWGPGDKAQFKDKLVLPRIVGLEYPTFVPDFDKFKTVYDKYGADKPVLVLQGHPGRWVDEARWNGFVRIIEFLKARNCVFMTPSQYQQSLQPGR